MENRSKFTTDEVVYEYTNDINGLHQTFLIKKRPVAGNPVLDLATRLDGIDLALDPSGTFVSFFKTDTGEKVMRYTDLAAFDALGRNLSAKMDVTPQKHIALVVDDTNALYPVLVNPFNRMEPPLFGDQTGAHLGEVGRVFVWYGTNNVAGHSLGTSNRVADVVYTGSVGNAQLGVSVSTGDVNEDGFVDLIVGVPGPGNVYFYKGSTTGLPSSPNVILSGSPSGTSFGYSVSYSGQITSRGFSSVLVGGPGYSSGSGKLYLFEGNGSSAGLNTTPFWSKVGDQTGANLGHSVFGGKLFIDGQTSHDFVAGAPLYDVTTNGTTFVDAGRVYVFRNWNPTTLEFDNIDTLETPDHQAGAKFGWSVSAGDLDSPIQSLDDVIVGAPFYEVASPGDDKGMVYVFWGNAGGPPGPATSTDSKETSMTAEHFGSSVAFIPKITGGDPCFIAGAPEAKPSNITNAGEAMVFFFTPPR